MVRARMPDITGWAARLARRAQLLAEQRTAAPDPARWRDPRWLWPAFTREE